MPRVNKPSPSQQEAAAKNSGEKALKATTTEEPERLSELCRAATEAADIYRELNSRYQNFACALTTASALKEHLQGAGLSAEASIVEEIYVTVKKHFELVRLPLTEATIKAEIKYKEALKNLGMGNPK